MSFWRIIAELQEMETKFADFQPTVASSKISKFVLSRWWQCRTVKCVYKLPQFSTVGQQYNMEQNITIQYKTGKASVGLGRAMQCSVQ